jgi:hypothetical protein
MSSNEFNWKMYIILVIGVVPLALMMVHQLIAKSIIPWSVTSKYIYLFYAYPNIFSMYFSNFVHAPTDHGVHLFTNVFAWLLVMALIILVYLYIAPSAKYRISQHIEVVSPKILWACTIVNFLLVPFVVSMVSIVAARTIDSTAVVGYGFSGIIYAFGGYLAYLCRDLMIKKVQATRRMKFTDNFIAFMVPFGFLLSIVADAMTWQGSNWVGHLAGFVVGYVAPWTMMAIGTKGVAYD